ncbi:uncharacterized protein N7483_000059 [Penicillium malachiteum]|uniref:uncharacterized protein n=1 Tax=Penicillium malachiteum TaxID=1324776 RepID=UPI0025478663|nr:uncharacterized protein N7483_000059 [Penicillium malachiteum]KAJ5734934.1 hypothetical protein N7483_000059 [Penicillium malachiteum]
MKPQWVNMETADDQSFDATSRLFNWHRYRDHGLWLEDRNVSIDDVRRIQLHPWIEDIFSDGDDPIKENPRPEIDLEAILKWCHEIEDPDSVME